MSLRSPPLYRSIAPLYSARYIATRPISTSAVRKAGGASHAHEEDPNDDTKTKESYLNAPWRNTLILTTLFIISYPYLPSTPKGNVSPTMHPERFNALKNDPSTPWITKWIARFMQDPEVLREKQVYHLGLMKREADKRMRVADIERPRMRRIGGYEDRPASPYNQPIGE